MTSVRGRVVVTGAFSYIGAAVARELLERGYTVHTLTNRQPAPDAPSISPSPLIFERDRLARALEAADVFVNTYWIRLPYRGQTFATAVANSRILLEAACRAGVRRVVHVSVSNASAGRNLGYYAGKAEVEEIVRQTCGSFAIVRPTLVVGPSDVLTNNIAWFLRRFPLFPMPDGGGCRLQPVTLDDTGRIICDALAANDNIEVDAAGPEIFTFRDFVARLAQACGVHRWLPPTPRWLALAAIRLVEPLLRDITLTREELFGLQQELLLSHTPPLGGESVARWLQTHGATLGRRYANDLDRHFRGGKSASISSGTDFREGALTHRPSVRVGSGGA